MKMTCKLIGLAIPAFLLAGCGQDQPASEEALVVEEAIVEEKQSNEHLDQMVLNSWRPGE
jgi:hypothetical protein